MTNIRSRRAHIVVLVWALFSLSGCGASEVDATPPKSPSEAVMTDAEAATGPADARAVLTEEEAIARARVLGATEVGAFAERTDLQIRTLLSDGYWQVEFSDGSGKGFNAIIEASSGTAAEIGSFGF